MVVSPFMYTVGTLVGGISIGVIGTTVVSITKRKLRPGSIRAIVGLILVGSWIAYSIHRAHEHLAGHVHALHSANETYHAEKKSMHFPAIPDKDIRPTLPPPPPPPPPRKAGELPPNVALNKYGNNIGVDERWPRKPMDNRDWTDDDLHIVFSTGCSPYQQWQSELLFYTHKKVGQKGRITRLVSGCENHETIYWSGISADTVSTEVLHRSTVDDPRYKVHVTPHFPGSNRCPFINKPNSVNHWAHHGETGDLSKQVVVIIDPDEMMLRPLELLNRDLFYKPHLYSSPESKISPVQPSRPIAQYYQIGSSWVKGFDQKDYVKASGFPTLTSSQCGPGGKCTKVTEKEVWDHFSPGPPYFVHGQDIMDFSATWANYTPALANVSSNSLYTEMWSYGMAAANNDMPHTHLTNFMISHALSRDQEAWVNWADEQQKHGMSCRNPKPAPGVALPPFLHFCQNIRANDKSGVEWMWHKGHVPKNIFDCDLPIIKPPPDNLFNVQKDQTGYRNAWILCNLIAHLNEMVIAYKTKFCPADNRNTSKMIRLYQGNQIPRGGCKQENKKLCFPLALLEPEPVDL